MKPVTKNQYKRLTCYEKGYISYIQGEWNKDIDFDNPYKHGTKNFKKFEEGSYDAYLDVLDIDDEK